MTHPPKQGEPIREKPRRIRNLRRSLWDFAFLYADEPEMAGHYAVAGSYLMQMKRPGLARRYFAAACRITPKNPRFLAHLAFSHMPGLHAWARGHSARLQ